MTTTLTNTTANVNAGQAATAWLNAFLASSQDGDNTALYRTLSVEFFDTGVQFIGCDGTLLFRTWAPCTDASMPLIEEVPNESIVVMDVDKFAVAFIRTLLAASKDAEFESLLLAIEPAPQTEEPLGEQFAPDMLTLSAFGQQLHCKLYEAAYPDWRRLQYGIDKAELVDGMTIATRMFATVGKLKGISSVACDFHGKDRQIVIHGTGVAEVSGLMMPMRRAEQSRDDGES